MIREFKLARSPVRMHADVRGCWCLGMIFRVIDRELESRTIALQGREEVLSLSYELFILSILGSSHEFGDNHGCQ